MKFGNGSGSGTQLFGRGTRALLVAACWITSSSIAFAQTPGLVEGDAWHKADVAKATYGVKGSVVKVCVMSDSIDNGHGALASAQTSHDIPCTPTTCPLSLPKTPSD